MQLNHIKMLRDGYAKFLKHVPAWDPSGGHPKYDENGNVVYEDVPSPLMIRLDNEHIIEYRINEVIWDDAEELIYWAETPTRGNSSVSPTGGMGNNIPAPLLWSCAEYSEIQQISWFPTKDQMKAYLKTKLSSNPTEGDGKILEEDAVKMIVRYFIESTQQFQIVQRSAPTNIGVPSAPSTPDGGPVSPSTPSGPADSGSGSEGSVPTGASGGAVEEGSDFDF